jgi:polysaccharide deacetylase family sporulation protein PdaB
MLRIFGIRHKRIWPVILSLIIPTAVPGGARATVRQSYQELTMATASRPVEDRYSLRDVATTKKVAALTFDISWGTVMPPKVLAILKRDHVPSTIFVSGPWAQQHPQIVRDYAQAGAEVESHGWSHVNYSGLSNRGIVENLLKTDKVLRDITGQRPTFVRPPNGDFNSRSILAARSVGYVTVTWGTDSLDWMNPGVSTIINRVTGRIHPGDIVLMHASDTCKQTDIALPAILLTLRKQGYHLVTLKQLLTYGKPIYRG